MTTQDGINLLNAIKNNDTTATLKLISVVPPLYQDLALRVSVRDDKWDIFIAILPLVPFRTISRSIAAEEGKLKYLEALLTPEYECDDVVIVALNNHQMEAARLLLAYKVDRVFTEYILERLIHDNHEDLFDIFIANNPGHEYDFALVEAVKASKITFITRCLTLNITRVGYVNALYEMQSVAAASVLLSCDSFDVDYELRDSLMRYYTEERRMDIVEIIEDSIDRS